LALRVLEVRTTVRVKLVLLAPGLPRTVAAEDLDLHVGDLGVVAVGELAVRVVVGDADEVLLARRHRPRNPRALPARVEAPTREPELAGVPLNRQRAG